MGLWTEILKIGDRPQMTGLEKGRIMMLNGVVTVTSLSVIIFSVIYAIVGYQYFFGPLYILPIAALVFTSNYYGQHANARNIYFVGSLIVICFWCYQGRGNGNEYTLIGLATTSTLLYTRRITIYLINLICIILFLSDKYLESVFPFTPDPSINYNIVPWIILLNTLAVITFQVAFFRDLAHHYDKKLSIKYKEQAIILSQQKIIEEELKTSNDKLYDMTEHLESTVKEKTEELNVYIEAISMNTFSTVSDLNGCFTSVNDLVIKLSGYEKKELLGKHYNMLASGLHPEEFFLERRTVLMEGKTWRGEVEHKTKQGALHWFDCVVIPIRNGMGTINSFLTLGLPITERKLNDKIRTDTYDLLEAITFSTSHSIRGPLARIKGLSDLVRKDLVSAEEFKLVAEKLVVCCEELNTATSELVAFVHSHQKMIIENKNQSNISSVP